METVIQDPAQLTLKLVKTQEQQKEKTFVGSNKANDEE